MNTSIREQTNKAPQSPGIYIFKDKKGEFLYIGKAGNLKNRLRQYLNRKIRAHKDYVLDRALKNFSAQAYSPFMEHLLNEAEKLETKITDSEIEALILESKLIKEKQPKFNIMLRDDKQYFYVVFTKEKFPKIFLTHQLQIDYIGPFTDGMALKTTLRLLRRIFPYCTCKQPHHNFCLNYHIGNCPGYCCLKNAKITKKETEKYKRNIKIIKNILSGEKNAVIKNLNKELKELGREEHFEEAIELRNKIEKLEKVFTNAKIIQEYRPFDILKYKSTTDALMTLKKIFNLQKIPRRIEGYDISNIQGKNAVGAMVVFSPVPSRFAGATGQANGRPDPEGIRRGGPYGASKNEYRKFKIKFKKTPDDTAMLKETLTRRFNHPEWPYPDLIFIDGGKGQLNVAAKAASGKIPVISLAKGKNEVFSSTLKRPLSMKKLPNEIKNLVLNIDSEAHRFAISYYRKIHRKKTFQ
ncbi:MAG: GIY-YIG nuclease family protein [Patescibacteria group bacterium]